MRSVALFLLVLIAGQLPGPRPAQASEPDGRGPLVVGYTTLTLAALSLVSAPLCFARFFPAPARDACFGGTLSLSGIAVGVGLPTTLAGRRQRERRKALQSQARSAPRWLPAPLPGGAALHYRRSF